MFGANLTLIVLTSGRLARIDLAGPRRQLRVERAVSCPAIDSSELAAAVAIAYRAGEPRAAESFARKSWLPSLSSHCPRTVIVLSDDIWNDSITLPLDVTVLLRPAELRQALGIEAQNYSGIDAFSSQFVTRQLLDMSSNLVDTSSNFASANSWWVAQASNSDLANMFTAAQACGFKLLGAAHTLAYQYAQPAEYAESADSARLVATANLEDQPALIEFGTRWAHALSQSGCDLLIRPEVDASTKPNRLGWLQTSAALAAVICCAIHYHARTTTLNETGLQLKQLQKTLSEYDATAAKLRTAQTQQQPQQTSQKTLPPPSHRPQPPRPVSLPIPAQANPSQANPAHISKWLSIFDSLVSQTPEECWIESWRSSAGNLTLVGRAEAAQPIHEFAGRLEQLLHDQQWRVLPPSLSPDEQGLLHFELPLAPASRSGEWQ